MSTIHDQSVATLHRPRKADLHCVARGYTLPFSAMELPILTSGDFQKACGERLEWLMRQLDMTNVQAGKLMGVSKHVINHWISGNNPVQPYPLYRLCKAKNIDFNFVYLGDWSRLPYEMAKSMEEELTAKLAPPLEQKLLAAAPPPKPRRASQKKQTKTA